MTSRRVLPSRVIIGALWLSLITACGTGNQAVVAVSSVSDMSTGQPAAVATSCPLAMNDQALVPGSARPTAGDTARVGDAASTATSVALVLAQGALAFTNGPASLAGWAMTELLGSGQTGPSIPPELQTQLDQLTTQITAISDDVNAIEAQISALLNEIKDTTYVNAIKQFTNDHVAPIEATWQTYCNLLVTKTTDSGTLSGFADAVTNPATGMRAHLTSIAAAFKGSAITGDVPLPGMFATFVIDQNPEVFDDTSTYQNHIQPYTAYFVNLMVMGMSMMIEALHYQGDDEGAQSALADLWADIRDVYQAGGAPVTDANVIAHIPSLTVWARAPLCVPSEYSSDDIVNGSYGNAPLQAMIANSVLDAWTIGNNGSGDAFPPPDYEFEAGNNVCSAEWYPNSGNPSPASWLPAAIQQSPIVKTLLWDGTGDSSDVWRDPTAADFTALLSADGGASPQAYLNQNGFSIGAPQTNATTQLPYGYWRSSDAGFLDAVGGGQNCLFAANCQGYVFGSFLMVSTPPCMLGSGPFQGLPKPCGTSWVDALWTAAPPPPVTPTSGSETTAPTS